MSHLIFRISLVLMVFFASFIAAQPVANEHSIKFENSTTATLVGEDGVIMRTVDNGVTWVQQESNLTNALYGNSSRNGVSLAVGELGVVLRSTDAGANWNVLLPGTLKDLRDVEVLDNNNAVICGLDGIILVSDNAGLTWDSVASGTANDLMDIEFIDADNGFAIGELGTLIKTTDHGLTWETVDISFTTANFNSIEAVNSDLIFIAGNNGTLFITENGGITWFAPFGMVYETDFNEVVFFDSNNGVIAANDGLILKTTDAGYSWAPANTFFSGDDYDFLSVAFADQNNGISTGKTGVEVYTTDGGNTWTETAPVFYSSISSITGSKNPKNMLEQNYPNPFNPSTKISYTLPVNASVSLKVFDMTGKEVANLVNSYQNKGNYNVTFNAANLSSGVYFYRLAVNDGTTTTNQVMRMILTK